MCSRSAISWLDSPRATSRAPHARGRSGRRRRGPRAAGRAANRSISRRVTPGASRASPAATTRSRRAAGSARVSLSRNPLAPGAQRLVHELVVVERREHEHARGARTPGRPGSRRVASRPSIPGIRTSISTTSGAYAGTEPTPPPPSPASPTTSMSAAEPSSTTTRTAPAPGCRRPRPGSTARLRRRRARADGPHLEPAVVTAPYFEGSTDQPGALPQPETGRARRERVPSAGRPPLPGSRTSRSSRPLGRAPAPCRIPGAGVLEHVGQRLLHDPVGRQLDAVVGRASRGPSRQRDAAPAAPTSPTSASRSSSPCAGRRGRSPSSLAEQAEDRPGLGRAPPAGLGDDVERAFGGGSSARMTCAADPGLHGDQRHAVRHHVVQFPGDPEALLDTARADCSWAAAASCSAIAAAPPAGRDAIGSRYRGPTRRAAGRTPAQVRGVRSGRRAATGR